MYKCINETYVTYQYRLGDIIKSKKWRHQSSREIRSKEGIKMSSLDYHLKHYPNSIAVEYISRTDTERDLDVLYDIVRARTVPSLIPDKNTLVIHLRIGDVIDGSKFSIDDFLDEDNEIMGVKYNKRGVQYVRPISFYKKIVQQIQNLPIKKVILVGGFHIDGDHSKSLEYVKHIKNFFESHNYMVTERIDHDPDEDFIFMSNSTYFVQSGGGFSKLIADLVKNKMNNNLVIGN
jgi:hypothetical protein